MLFAMNVIRRIRAKVSIYVIIIFGLFFLKSSLYLASIISAVVQIDRRINGALIVSIIDR